MAHIRNSDGTGDESDYVPLAPPTADDDAIQHSPLEPKRTNITRRLSAQHLAVLFLGSAAIPLVFLFLGLLWKESRIASTGAAPRTPWIYILRANWAPSAVTICTVVIRTLVALQASLVTAMLGGYILETIGVPLFQAPFYSIIRALNVTPTNLLYTIVVRSKDALSIFIYTLVVAEVLVTIASQFLSTIFLSDFTDRSFANLNSSTTIPTLERGSTVSGVSKWWTSSPESSWTFAELPGSFEKGDNFHDTGHIYRAFLPFEDAAQRTSLRKFHGPATIMDHRVVCGRPSLSNVTVDEVARLTGTMTMDVSSYPMLQETRTQQYFNFSCGVPGTFSALPTELGQSSLCFVGSDEQWTVLLEDPLVDPSSPLFSDPEQREFSMVPAASTMFMVLDSVTWDAFSYNYGERNAVEVIRNDGPWATVTNGSEIEGLRLTTCFTNLGTRTFIVDMHSSSARDEPRLPWISKNHGYDAESSLRQLGASSTPGSLEDRGVLRLGPKSQWKGFDNKNDTWSAWFFSENLIGSTSFVNNNLIGAPENRTADPGVMFSKRMLSKYYAHKAHTAIFLDALNSTRSPALAAQALFTRIHQMAYYDAIPNVMAMAVAETSFSTSALVPVHWAGFTSAVAIIAVHFVLFLIITVMFLWSTSHSLLGNHWQSISQVISEDSEPLLQQANNTGDKDIKSWAEGQSVDLQRYAVLRRQRDGRVALGL